MRCPHCEHEFSFKTRAKLSLRSEAACPSCGRPCYLEEAKRPNYALALLFMGMGIGGIVVTRLAPQSTHPMILVVAIFIIIGAQFSPDCWDVVAEHSEGHKRQWKFLKLAVLCKTGVFLLSFLLLLVDISIPLILVAMFVLLSLSIVFLVTACCVRAQE